jgi:Domain of unknown function (DUF4288)
MAVTLKESWFTAVLVFQSEIEGAWSDRKVEIQHRLIRAPSPERAFERATVLGDNSQLSYQNTTGETCRWIFKGLADLQCIMDENLGDGVEVYGFIEEGNASDWVVRKDQLSVFFGRDRKE